MRHNAMERSSRLHALRSLLPIFAIKRLKIVNMNKNAANAINNDNTEIVDWVASIHLRNNIAIICPPLSCTILFHVVLF